MVERAAEVGIEEAQLFLGKLYSFGLSDIGIYPKVERDLEKAMMWTEKAFAKAMEKDGNALDSEAAELLEDQIMVTQWLGIREKDGSYNDINAQLRAAQFGYPDAQFKTGLRWLLHEDADQRYKEKGFEFLLKAAEQGHVEAMYITCQCYFIGKGTEKNEGKGMIWLYSASGKGSVKARTELGRRQMWGQGTAKNEESGLYFLQIAANDGDAEAQSYLGDVYVTGTGVKESASTAAMWYKKAADQSHAEAQLQLGIMYFIGEGVPEDRKTGVRYIKMAANQGHEAAKDFLRKRNL